MFFLFKATSLESNQTQVKKSFHYFELRVHYREEKRTLDDRSLSITETQKLKKKQNQEKEELHERIT